MNQKEGKEESSKSKRQKDDFNVKAVARSIMKKLNSEKGRVGAPYAITQRKLEVMFDGLLKGNYREIVFKAARINYQTIYNYLKTGEEVREAMEKGQTDFKESELGFVEFLEAMEYCEAKSEVNMVGLAQIESPLRFIQIRYRDRYYPNQKQQLANDPEHPMPTGQVVIYIPSNQRGPDGK